MLYLLLYSNYKNERGLVKGGSIANTIVNKIWHECDSVNFIVRCCIRLINELNTKSISEWIVEQYGRYNPSLNRLTTQTKKLAPNGVFVDFNENSWKMTVL